MVKYSLSVFFFPLPVAIAIWLDRSNMASRCRSSNASNADRLILLIKYDQGFLNFYHLSVICDKQNVEVDIEDLTLQYDDCMMPYWIP